MSLTEIVCAFMLITGTAFMLVSAVGIVRFPDFYVRMSAITKAGSMGLGLIMGSIAIYFNETLVAIKALAIIFFILLTSPVSAHLIGRAATKDGVKFWSRTFIEEFRPFLRKLRSENTQEPVTARPRRGRRRVRS